MRIRYLLQIHLSILVTLMLPVSAHSQGVLTQIMDNGPTDKRLNVVFLSEGYTIAESSQFTADANDLMTTMFSRQPFEAYMSYFNVFTIWVPSIQSGSDHPLSGIFRETYFNSTYDSYGIQRLITIPPNDWDGDWNNGAGKAYDLLALHMPDYDVVVIIVNDTEYGGSGGDLAITSVNPSAPEILLHEFGHTFGNLGDEYDTYTPGYYGYESPNTTAETDRELIKWTAWIDAGTPVPTPETETWEGIVGLFEGACYEVEDWYRPELNCKMKGLGSEFCNVCQDKLVKSHYIKISPIESYSPELDTIYITTVDTVSLTVVPMVPVYHELDIGWYLDSEMIPDATDPELMIAGDVMGGGVHELRVDVKDSTYLVRTDTTGLLTDSHLWIVDCELPYVCGDADDSGDTDIDDVVFLINFIFAGGPEPIPYESGDTNCSGTVDIDDAVWLINYIFSGGNTPCDTDGDGEPNC